MVQSGFWSPCVSLAQLLRFQQGLAHFLQASGWPLASLLLPSPPFDCFCLLVYWQGAMDACSGVRYAWILMLIFIQNFVTVKARLGLDSALSQSHLDPLAMNDTFLTLPPAVRNLLLHPLNFDTNQKLHHLHSLQCITPVTVKLVGFSRGDLSQFQLQFSRYLDAFNQEAHVNIIGSHPHKLTVKAKIDLQITRVSPLLADKIYQAIEQTLADRPSITSHNSLEAVPYSLVDEIVQADLEKPLSAYVIYLLNLKHQRVSYAYRYSAEQDPYVFKCLGSSWAGRDRYMWVDLAAGPVEYGPAISGEGLVVKAETHPLAALQKGRSASSSFLADLASVVWSAAQMLLLPPLRIAVLFTPDVVVHFIHIVHGRDDNGRQEENINWDAIESSFLERNGKSFAFASQLLQFQKHRLDFNNCSLCAAILARSTKSYTSRVLLDRYSLFVNEYLDSKQLHYLLIRSQGEIAELAGIGSHAMSREISVYVFDLPKDKVLLLDRFQQAVAFRDMVIAIRTMGSHMISDFTCNGRSVLTRARDLERPIVGALLQTVWGVAPTHLRWSFQHNTSLVDYTWSVGQTPFGPFSHLFTLSFVQRDAASRNVLFTMLNSSIWSASIVLNSIQDQGGEKKLFGQKEHIEFTQRWNLFIFKLNKAVASMTHFDFNSALYFVKSAEHDLIAFHNSAFQATSSLQASIMCFTDPPFPWRWTFGCLSLVSVAFYLWIRRERLFVNKRKTF